KWNDKWSTFQRYLSGSARATGAGFDDTTNWTVGVKYYYTPALSFELAYDKIENSQTLTAAANDDNVIRLRTRVTF
ncbi:MAG: porin, partial [Aminobacterium colombiense]|nr:porin [Aminobacterium colombiense]